MSNRTRFPGTVYRQAWLSAYQVAAQPPGTYTLPSYQRGYVWEPEQACYLVETMLLGLPIGSVILWERADTVLVIDGQQRISTLQGMSMGHGGDVPVISVEPCDGPVPVRAVIGAGPGRVPVSFLFAARSRMGAVTLAAAGLDPTQHDCSGSGSFGVLRSMGREWDGVALEALCYAEEALRSSNLPGLLFNYRATTEQVVEAFRRINLGGTPIPPDAVERLVAGMEGEQ